MMRLLCRLLGHRWVPLHRSTSEAFDCLVCTRCRENGWRT